MKTNQWITLGQWEGAPPDNGIDVLVCGGEHSWGIWRVYSINLLIEEGRTHFMILEFPSK